MSHPHLPFFTELHSNHQQLQRERRQLDSQLEFLQQQQQDDDQLKQSQVQLVTQRYEQRLKEREQFFTKLIDEASQRSDESQANLADQKRQHEEELAALQSRIQTMIDKKDAVLNALRQQIFEKDQRLVAMEQELTALHNL